jgi:predicted DNA-binding transcriptional regulator YafY
MLETSARLLRLLSLLQGRRDWTGPALAERLGVTTRTVRNDVERLRSLGYPVDATPGAAGGYRLGVGAALPPLLLDDEEAVAVAVGLRTAAGGTIAGIEETSLRALTKLEQVLPSRLRHRVNAVQAYTVPVPGSGPVVDAGVLATLAATCRDHERLRFDYAGHDGTETVRTTEPHRLVHTRGRWYLVAWDVDRRDWRTFRVDRVRPRVPTGPRFTPRDLPGDGDVATYVTERVGAALWRHRARIRLHAPAEHVAARLPAAARVEPVDSEEGEAARCEVEVGADTYHMLAHYIGLLDVDFEVLDSPELADHVRRLAARYTRAAGG